MVEKRRKLLRKSALRLEQNSSHPLYLFSLTPEEIRAVSDVSRLSRSDGGKLLGYQRGEVRRAQVVKEWLGVGERKVQADERPHAILRAVG